jgi:hypothetical protein
VSTVAGFGPREGTVTTVSPTLLWSLATADTTHRTDCPEGRLTCTLTVTRCDDPTWYDAMPALIAPWLWPIAAHNAQAPSTITRIVTDTTPVRRLGPRVRRP